MNASNRDTTPGIRRRAGCPSYRAPSRVVSRGDHYPRRGGRPGDQRAVRGRGRTTGTVIPTCVDLERFAVSEFPATPVRLLISGTLNNRYDVDGMLRLGPAWGGTCPYTCRFLPGSIPFRSGVSSGWCRCRRGSALGDAGARHPSTCWVSLLKPGVTPASKASVPTKLAEFLACGRPIAVSRHLGDMDELIRRYDCGVVIRDTSDDELTRCIGTGTAARNPSTPQRCPRTCPGQF